ncbi:MAG: hypothetical protein DYG88_04705 [Chloroflexi bacterium CFX4]|nr:hypothetical protein [Chloroflexi bacterium CFX4]MDL1924123.1 hypothetical protein [Chloroflexi bacterium CFX3]
MSDPAVRVELEGLLNSPISDAELVRALLRLAQTHPEPFSTLAELWANKLYERDRHFFHRFLIDHLNKKQHSEVLEALLARAEADQAEDLWRDLYHLRETGDYWKAQVLARAQSGDLESLRRFLNATPSDHDDETAVAVYHAEGDAALERLRNTLRYDRPYPQLTALVNATAPESRLAAMLFKWNATPDAWYERVRQILAAETPESSSDKVALLHHWQPEKAMSLPPDLIYEIKAHLGASGECYLLENVDTYALAFLEAEIAALKKRPPNAEADRDAIRKWQDKIGYRMLQHLTAHWLEFVFERAPHVFVEMFHYAHNDRPLLKRLAERAHHRHAGAYRALMRYLSDHEAWHADVLSALHSNQPLDNALEGLDIYGMRLTDEVATALYRQASAQSLPFIERHMLAARGRYPNFLAALEAAADTNYPRFFRKFATDEQWRAKLSELLAADMPADEIVAALEMWHLTDPIGKPTILADFFAKYGEAVLPYMERYLNWASEARLRALLALDIDRGALLRELSAIARRQASDFSAQADVWARELYRRGGDFFAPLLIRYLNRNHEYLIRELLPEIAQNGHTQLYTRLYALIIRDDGWRAELARLAAELRDDEELAKALELRDVRGFQLNDAVASALYSRNPERFGDFVRAHVQTRHWWSWGDQQFNKLRDLAKRRGDQALLDAFVDERPNTAHVWKVKLEALWKEAVPADQIVARLREIHPRNTWEVQDSSPLLAFIDRYGEAVMPYILQHTHWIKPHEALLKAVERHCTHSTYWQVVFQVGDVRLWQKALEELLKGSHSEAQFLAEVAPILPDVPQGWWGNRWQISADFAEKLYQRFGSAVRPILETYLQLPSHALFKQAVQREDTDFLIYLTFRLLIEVGQIGGQLASRWYRGDATKDRQKITQYSEDVVAYLSKLHAADPLGYVRFAAAVLTQMRAFQINRWNNLRQNNRIWDYLTTQHREVWLHVPEAISELLESPSIYVILFGLELLNIGDAFAAARVVENLPTLRAFLLGRFRRETKHLVLAALEAAAAHGAYFARQILPALDAVADFRARTAVPDDILATYVRLQQQIAAQEAV